MAFDAHVSALLAIPVYLSMPVQVYEKLRLYRETDMKVKSSGASSLRVERFMQAEIYLLGIFFPYSRTQRRSRACTLISLNAHLTFGLVQRPFSLDALASIFWTMNSSDPSLTPIIAGGSKQEFFLCFLVQKLINVEEKYGQFENFWKSNFIDSSRSQSVIICENQSVFNLSRKHSDLSYRWNLFHFYSYLVGSQNKEIFVERIRYGLY